LCPRHSAAALLLAVLPLPEQDRRFQEADAARGMGDRAGFEHRHGRRKGHPVRLDDIFPAARQWIKDKLFGQEDMIDAGNDRRKRLDAAERSELLRPIAGLFPQLA
jgi:hypothetical protein